MKLGWGSLKKSKRAAVLGCGPAGLFAAHALRENGWDVLVFSKARPSHLYGAQYLHAPIPGLTPEASEPVRVKYRLAGTVDQYREKVYGVTPVKVSVETLTQEHPGWDIRATYDAAWSQYHETIYNAMIDPNWLQLNGREFDIVLNSIPLPSLCYQPDEHEFHSTQVWAIGDAPDRGQYAPYRPDPNTVECNGTGDTGWYRAANVFGYTTVEWPGNRKPPLPAATLVTKPLYSTCTCYRRRENGFKFMPIGRYGQWSKGVLSHHAYTQAAQI